MGSELCFTEATTIETVTALGQVWWSIPLFYYVLCTGLSSEAGYEISYWTLAG